MKDSQFRTITKTISWRVAATITTFLIAWFVFREDPEVFEKASLTAAVEVFSKLALYYLHERIWTNINWGRIYNDNKD